MSGDTCTAITQSAFETHLRPVHLDMLSVVRLSLAVE